MIDTKKSWWMPALLGVLAALLPVLAVLQYQWIGAVSDGEQARMQRMLQAGVRHFADDFAHPLERAREAFLHEAVPAREALAAHLVHRYQRWQTGTSDVAFLEAAYWIEYDADNAPRLHRLDTAAVALVPEAWPEGLAAWHAFFTRAAPPASGLPPPSTVFEAAVPAEPPGLSIPLLPAMRRGPGETATNRAHAGFLLLLLDQTYIAQTIFPALARTYFLDDHDAAYDVLILHQNNPDRVVYRSDPDLHAADFATPDAATDLGLAGRINVTTYITDDGNSAEVMVQKQAAPGRGPDREVTRDTETVVYEKERVDDVMRAPSLSGIRSGPGRPGEMLANTSGPIQPWRLLVRHKAGSIEAAIGAVRRRTLGIGFGILLVLGGAAALLFISARRARRLAEQQMAFVAGVTHELRTPLAVIRSAAENLADGVITDSEKARRYGALIHSEGRRLSEIVEQALALAGAQSNHAALDLKPVAVEPLVEQALARCRPTLEAQDAAVTLALAEDLPPVRADAHALEAALCNLITNASKYGGPSARIHLEARPAPHGRTPSVHLTVRDHGPGIPADELPHLFEPFYRGRAARQAQIRGSGLGLSLVKNTIEAHGGRISVESAVGQGSAFTIHLPVA